MLLFSWILCEQDNFPICFFTEELDQINETEIELQSTLPKSNS